MPIPTKTEIDKKNKALEDHLKKLDEDGRIKERTAVSMLRSAIRQVWMRSPNKLAVLEKARIPDLDPTTRTKWLFKCEICGGLFKEADTQIDHRFGNHSFRTINDFKSYWENILNAPMSSLQVVCKTDHAIKTYMEANNITWEEAVSMKQVIAKLNQPVATQKRELKELGYSDKDISNPEKRKAIYKEIL